MDSRAPLVAALALLVFFSVPTPEASAQLAAERVYSGFDFCVLVTSIPGDADRLFLVEKSGSIRIFKNGSLLSRPFLDIQGVVNVTHNEQGLLGLAFHPDYAVNGQFFVYYTAGSGAGESVIERYTVSSDPDSADAATAHPVLQIPQLTNQHNGGTILFGSDDYLYLGLGESNWQDMAQDPLELLGKMIRIDVDADDFPADANRNYAIPPDNPFVGDPTVLDEIWALGMRNPYRFSFDRLTGDLYIADVGQDAWEEIDFEPAGSAGAANYGWPLMEGPDCFAPPTDCDDGSLSHPIHTYPHVEPSCWSITGGVVYRGNQFPSLQGRYFFGDFCNGNVWSLTHDQGTVNGLTEWTDDLVPVNGGFIWNVSSIGEDGLGEIYITSANALFRIIPDTTAVSSGIPERAERSGFRGVPNPFSEGTRFELPPGGVGPVEIAIYSAAGRLVRRYETVLGAGRSALVWDGRDSRGRRLPGGVYFVRAQTAQAVRVTRVTVVR